MSPMIGETRIFAFNFAPQGWAPCQGQLLPIDEFSPLFMVIGTTYGGDGATTFALPDAKGPVSGQEALQVCINLDGSFPTR